MLTAAEDDGQANALAQALVEELECGMCAGVYIEVRFRLPSHPNTDPSP